MLGVPKKLLRSIEGLIVRTQLEIKDNTNGIIRDDSERYLTMHYNITVENIPRKAKRDLQHGGGKKIKKKLTINE
jgi:hypothetical protein